MTVSTTTKDTAAAVAALQEALGDRVGVDREVRESFRTDFGKVRERVPAAVVRPRSAQEVVTVVRTCREHGVPLTPRAQGHTQTGQSTTEGILLDTNSMATIHEIDAEREVAVCDPGVVWRDLVAAAVPQGLVPRVLTNNLGVTIAGTTSVAGLGVASYRYGTQADNAVEIDVVAGTGELVTCSREQNRDLFDAVRCGFGQFGVMTRVVTRLRRCEPKVRMYHLLYDELASFMDDAAFVMDPANHDRFHTLESRCAPCPIFTKRIGEGMKLRQGQQLYAYWMYPMFLTVEYDEGAEPDDEAVLDGLSYYKHLRTEEYTQLDFCNRLEPIFELWHRSGNWELAHPWVETTLGWEEAKTLIPQVLEEFPPQALGPGGHILLWPARSGESEVPLFRHPEGENLMGFGILPAVPFEYLGEALPQLEMFSELTNAYGGKRYLSGYVSYSTAGEWATHFGDEWERVKAAKKKFDPDGIMNPGFIVYE